MIADRVRDGDIKPFMKPLRILHVVGSMTRGGIETWLMHILRHIDRNRFQIDILVHTDQPAPYDNEVRALGSRILRCSHTRNPLLYAARFLRVIAQTGPFDVLHSHVTNLNGFVLALGRIGGIPVRIAHSHLDTPPEDLEARLGRRIYLDAMARLIRTQCTDGLAASELAAAAMFGPDRGTDRRFRILHCGIDLAPFRSPADPAAVRGEFGFSTEDTIFGHVGRFDAQKNHAFLADIAAEIAQREPRARFLLVGEGPLRPSIEGRFRNLGIGDRTVFVGSRPDVPRLMLGAMDKFLFPSLYEGLGLVLVEAQAANLPSIVSDKVPAEAIVVPSLVRSVSLGKPAAVWAESALRQGEHAPCALAEVERSPFNISVSVEALTRVYCKQAPCQKQQRQAPVSTR
jgi:glycosyltransferase involved in cell wall biosynthesis